MRWLMGWFKRCGLVDLMIDEVVDEVVDWLRWLIRC